MTTGAHALPAGLRLGAYEIVSPLQSGGMAAVYLGRRSNTPNGAYVAIKVVHPKFADDPAFVAMFLDEARLSSRIHHRNVVRVEATGHENGLYYMVMEYLHGAPLQLFVRKLAEKKRALRHEVIVRIVASVAEGLHAAHEATDEEGRPLGIVHRDVTPQNVLVSYGGGVKLIDFGIAKAAGRVHQTAKGLLKGKVRYMAPEQAAGRTIDRRTDVYALGIVLWEMLTYRKAFSAKTDAELFRLVLAPKIVVPSRLNPSVPRELDGVAMTALAPAADERFQTALAFRNALYGAMPAAQRVDDAELAELLKTVLADQLASDAKMLPPSVVISSPRAVGVAGREDALTEVVPSLVPDDDEDERAPTPAPPPAAREPRATPGRGAPTAFGIGLAPPAPPSAAVGPAVAVAPTPSPSFAPPAMPLPTPVAAQAPMPALEPGIAPTRLSLPSVAQPPARPMAPAASFTPPNATQRPAIGARPPAFAAPATSAPTATTPPRSTGSRLLWGCAIAVGVVLTIALGTTIGWLVLHQATHAMTP